MVKYVLLYNPNNNLKLKPDEVFFENKFRWTIFRTTGTGRIRFPITL